MTAHTQTLRHSRFIQRSPIFYGWVVWLVATIGLFATSPGQSFSVSLFIDHYIVDFGLDRTTVSGLYGLGTFIAALGLTWVGCRIDRHGNRRMAMAIALLFALALVASAFVAGPLTILLSFIAIRGLGQGSLGLVNSTAVAQWFQRRRGQVMGFSLVAFALFQRYYVPWMQDLVETQGWRAAWIISGLTIALVVLPLLAVFIRDRPENFGLVPDGKAKVLAAGQVAPVEDNWELGEAMRTPIFWVFTFARMLAGAWGTALIFHQISLFEGLGYTPDVAANSFGQIALLTAGFTLLSGWLVDRLKPGLLIAVQMIGLMLATGLAMVMSTPVLLLAYTISFALFMSVGSVFDGTVWVTLFGRQHQGAIRGFVAMTTVIGTAIGPLVFGASFDYLGSYVPAEWLGIGLALVAMVAALIVKKPVRKVPVSAG
jgi:MFS family permease